MFKNLKNKLIVVIGPTACGKTKLATKLANFFEGEIISADSRQIYRDMDIGTGKDLVDYKIGKKNIPYKLIDIVSPKTDFNVAKYQKLAYRAIKDVLDRDKLPFLVGGTGLYIDAVVNGYVFQESKKLKKQEIKNIRRKLDRLNLKQLLNRLKKIDLATYKIVDKKNRRRVQRALEIYYETGIKKSDKLKSIKPDYDILVIGIKFPLEKIYSKIDSRLEKRIKEGMMDEIWQIKKNGVSWKRLDDFGLEYRWVSRYIKGDISYQTMISELRKAIHHFARRQLTWWRKNDNIIWVKNYSQAKKEINNFMK